MMPEPDDRRQQQRGAERFGQQRARQSAHSEASNARTRDAMSSRTPR